MASSSSSGSSSSSPCAACKFLRRKCTPECVFAPYFPPDQPHKFANVHKIFGASNITKLLNELAPHQREDAVNSLAYEADARVKDPVYGCVGAISMLQRQVARLQHDLQLAQHELSRYTQGTAVPGGPVALPVSHHQQHPQHGSPGSIIHGHHHHHGVQQVQQHSQQQLPLGVQTSSPQSSTQVHLGNIDHPSQQNQQQQQQQLLTRDQLTGIAREQQLTREQVLEIAKIGGGSYEHGLTLLGLIPPSRSSASGESGSSATGGFYH